MPRFEKEFFDAWAAEVGIQADDAHMEALRGEVGAILERLKPLEDMDVSDVPPEEAGLRHDGASA